MFIQPITRLAKAYRIILFATALCLTGTLLHCPAYSAKLPVFVSIIPQQYFVERIGGEFVDVSVMVQPGASPATYEPKPRQMAALAGARLYLAIGVPFEEAWLPRIQAANPQMRVVNIDAGIQKLPMAAHNHEEEASSKAEQHKAPAATAEAGANETDLHEGLDPHIWLSPMLLKPLSESIRKELIKADPAHAAIYRSNYAILEKELDAFDMELHDIFAPIPPEKRVFMVFHPSWGYFAMNYNLRQVPIEYEGKEPTPRILQELMEEAAQKNIRTIFVQPQFARKSADAIAAHIQGKAVIADPLAYNWFENLRSIARSLADSFSQ